MDSRQLKMRGGRVARPERRWGCRRGVMTQQTVSKHRQRIVSYVRNFGKLYQNQDKWSTVDEELCQSNTTGHSQPVNAMTIKESNEYYSSSTKQLCSSKQNPKFAKIHKCKQVGDVSKTMEQQGRDIYNSILHVNSVLCNFPDMKLCQLYDTTSLQMMMEMCDKSKICLVVSWAHTHTRTHTTSTVLHLYIFT